MTYSDTIIKQTQAWLSSVIIAYKLCPFAKREYATGRIHYAVIEAEDLHHQLERLIMECAALDNDVDRETSLLILPHGLNDFDDFLNALGNATALLEKQGYEGIYQLASFHPKYCFADVNPNDPSHYTNRSPYPMLHILREASIETAIKNYPNPEKIPDRNIQLTRGLGLKAMQTLLAACYK